MVRPPQELEVPDLLSPLGRLRRLPSFHLVLRLFLIVVLGLGVLLRTIGTKVPPAIGLRHGGVLGHGRPSRWFPLTTRIQVIAAGVAAVVAVSGLWTSCLLRSSSCRVRPSPRVGIL